MSTTRYYLVTHWFFFFLRWVKFYLRHFFNLTFYNYGVLIKIGDCFQTLLVFMKAFFLYVEERSPPDPSLSSLHHL